MFIKPQTSNYINNIFENYIDPSEINGTKRMHPSIEEFNEILEELQIEKQNVVRIRIEETSNPIAVPPHADLPEGFITTLVPLKFKPSVWTILFESFYLGNNPKGYKYRPSNKKYYEDEWLSEDTNNIDNINQQDFNDIHYSKYLSYISKKDLYGLKIQESIEWVTNKIIQFPSHQLHSGSCFQDSKRWLLVSSAIVS